MGELEGLQLPEAEDQLPDDQLFSETTVQDGMVPGLQFSEEDAGDALPAEEADTKSEETEAPAEAAVTVKVWAAWQMEPLNIYNTLSSKCHEPKQWRVLPAQWCGVCRTRLQ